MMSVERFFINCHSRRLLVQSFFDHTYSLLLMTYSGKAAESHIVCPVEASVLLRVLHSIGPVSLTLKVFSNLASLLFVVANRLFLFVLQNRVVKHIHFHCLLLVLAAILLQSLLKVLLAVWLASHSILVELMLTNRYKVFHILREITARIDLHRSFHYLSARLFELADRLLGFLTWSLTYRETRRPRFHRVHTNSNRNVSSKHVVGRVQSSNLAWPRTGQVKIALGSDKRVLATIEVSI